MAQHKRFQNIPIGWCGCHRGDFFEPMRLMTGRYESERVEIACSNCDGVAASFYRAPEIDNEPTKADRALIGQIIQVERFVAWVGYAKNTKTVFWSEEAERAKMAAMLAATVDIELDKAASILHVRQNGHYWLEVAAQRRARYLLFRQAFTSFPILPIRGLWFMDAERTVMISGVLRCLTGRRIAGSPSSDCHYDYDPPALAAQVHHQLYCGYSDDGQGALVYPGDCFAA